MRRWLRLAGTLLDVWRAGRRPPHELELRSRARLASLVDHARAHSPLYRRLYEKLPAGVDDPSLDNAPSSSPYLTSVGGTTLTTTGPGGSWSSETVWNWGLDGGSYVGSSGGISSYYAIPSWQTNVSMASNGGSTTHRNLPDVALTGDNIYVAYGGNGSGGALGGTSCAAPLWAGRL